MGLRCPKCNVDLEVRLTAAPPMQADQAQREANGDTGDLESLLDSIDDGSLSGDAVGFVEQTRERFKKYKDRTRMSPKQMAWLRRIASGEGSEW